MSEDQRLVTALFPNRNLAQEACRALPRFGVRFEDVSFVGPRGAITPSSGGGVKGEPTHHVRQTKISPQSGAATGAAVGGAIGILGGMLLGAGFIILPAVGLVIAGPLVGALVGAGLTPAVGNMRNALTGVGMSTWAAEQIEARVKRGEIAMALTVDAAEAERVSSILARLGGDLVATEHVAGVH